jgi:predicted metal-binding protein
MSTEGLEDLRLSVLESGAEDARIIPVKEVVVAEWPRWKCRYGCPNYGKNLLCPPNSPTPDETRRLLNEYEYAILVKHDSRRNDQPVLIELERRAFLSNLPKALALGSGRCRLCDECNTSGRCVHPGQARPSMEACGIDVFSTAHNAGYEMTVKTAKDQSYSRFSLLLLR